MPRQRKSIETHKLQGTYQRSVHGRRRDVEAPGELGPAPEYLSDAARGVWDEVTACMPPRLLAEADRFVVAAFAQAVAAWREACAMRARTPLLLRAQRGDRTVSVNPLSGEIRRWGRAIGELGAQIGATPQSRLRLMDGHLPPETDIVDPAFRRTFGGLRVIKGDRG